tara:strand:+ start:600 stop:707 length:108 start_codon:yes stop_codon:yes gene_type:complete
MASLAEIRAKLKEQEPAHRAVDKIKVQTQFTHFGI